MARKPHKKGRPPKYPNAVMVDAGYRFHPEMIRWLRSRSKRLKCTQTDVLHDALWKAMEADGIEVSKYVRSALDGMTRPR